MNAPFQRPGSTSWHWEFRRAGVRYCGSADTFKQAVDAMSAKRVEVQRDEAYEIAHGRKPFKPTRITVIAALDYFYSHFCATKRSEERDRSIISHLRRAWPQKMLHEITTEDVLSFRKSREDLGKAKATIAQEVGFLRRFFKQMLLLKKISESPAATVKKPRVRNDRVKYLDAQEATALLAASPPWLRDLITFARATACRLGEILRLRWTDVDLKRGLLTLGETKNDETGHVEINATTRTLLERLPRRIDGRVFPEVDPWEFRVAWKSAVLSAGLAKPCSRCEGTGKVTKGTKKFRCRLCEGRGARADFHFHDLRHDAATAVITQGGTLYDAQALLRHKSPAMTQRYSHLVRERRAATAALLDRHLAAEAAQEPRGAAEGADGGTRSGKDRA